MNTRQILNKEDGSAILMAMILLLVVTIIGISAINTTTTEIKIYHNEKVYQKNFYQAEAAVMEAALRLNMESNVDEIRPDSTTKNWLVNPDLNLENMVTFLSNNSNSLLSNDASFSANAKGIVSGASLDMTSDSKIYGFTIYGYSRDNEGNVFITIGFKKRI